MAEAKQFSVGKVFKIWNHSDNEHLEVGVVEDDLGDGTTLPILEIKSYVGDSRLTCDRITMYPEQAKLLAQVIKELLGE